MRHPSACYILLSAALGMAGLPAAAQSEEGDVVEVTKSQLNALTRTTSKTRVSVHDPSITRAGDKYYIFGSHRAHAYTADLQNWTSFTAPWGTVDADGNVTSGAANTVAFNKPQLTSVTQNGTTLTLPAFDAEAWSAAATPSYNVDGYMWAPDIIYNKAMKKWCMYLSIDGDNWASSIILLTSDDVEGPYVYQAPVVIGGFHQSTNSYTDTDLELALGTLSSLPARYNKGTSWGNYWPNNIDPSVFYDKDGQLWMSYGSWSGGIFLLRLDNESGLRDYSYTPAVSNDASGRPLADPYFGKRIAGGYYVSGEGSYIEHIGDYYYLFITYGELGSTGGYVMRVFRSADVEGPYVDAAGNKAIYSKYLLNYGKNDACNVGGLLMSAYNNLGNQTVGELSQGHNSALLDEDGRAYLVYHTRFNTGNEGHAVRVHQLFVNEDGWLVAAPFEFNGETLTDDSIKAGCAYTDEELAGTYEVLLHQYNLDASAQECALPQSITLTDKGTVTGDLKGSWSRTEGTGYVKLTVGGVVYKGVVMRQTVDGSTAQAIAFSAASSKGTALWGWKLDPLSALAKAVKEADMPISSGSTINSNLDFSLDLPEGVTATWSSSMPEVLSDSGKYSPTDEAETLTLTVTFRSGKYSYSESYSLKTRARSTLDADYTSGLVAYYDFNASPVVNRFDSTQVASLTKQSNGTKPTLDEHIARFGTVLHTYAGNEDDRSCSFATLANPLCGQSDLGGFTVALWVRRAELDRWGALWAFTEKKPAIYTTQDNFSLTGNCYLNFTSEADTFAINYPTTEVSYIEQGEWEHVIVTVSADTRLCLYVNGVRHTPTTFASTAGKTMSKFDFQTLLDFAASASYFTIGKGNGHGTPEALYDDLLIYNRALSSQEARALYNAESSVTPLSTGEFVTAIDEVRVASTPQRAANRAAIYDLSGRRVQRPTHGLYIIGGKKVYIK